jgi:hypothetical protein
LCGGSAGETSTTATRRLDVHTPISPYFYTNQKRDARHAEEAAGPRAWI